VDLRLITAPAAEPVAIQTAKEHLRLGADATDTGLVSDMLRAAREAVEAYTGRSLMPQTWQLRLPAFPPSDAAIRIPAAPIISVTELLIVAPDGAETVVATDQYQVETPSGPQAAPAQILPAYDTSWPETRERTLGAVRVKFHAGYANAAAVPYALKAGVLLFLTELYEQREASAPRPPADIPAVRRLLDPFRVWWI
jgi:uncharacterized phiE125 gp8 family phage protein